MQCLFKIVMAVNTREYSEETAYLFPVMADKGQGWSTVVKMQGKPTSFKLDTRGEVTAIKEEVYKTLKAPPLQQPTKIVWVDVLSVRSPGPIHRHYFVTCQDKSTPEAIYVVRGLKINLLGLPAIQSLQVIEELMLLAQEERRSTGSFQTF